MIVNEKDAIALLKKGHVIGIPTDTVYGFAVLEEFEYKIYNLKGRDKNKKLITMVGTEYMFNVAKYIKKDMLRFWPGQVTIIFEENGILNSYRIPNETNVIRMLNHSGLKIKTTSANKSGMPPCLTAEEFEQRFKNVPLLAEVSKVSKSKNPSKIFVYNRNKKIRIR